jgi:hypothetical protein
MFFGFAASLILCGSLKAQTIEPNEFMTWGIGDEKITVPVGSVITEAVLTIVGVSSLPTGLGIHLLDNIDTGFYVGSDPCGLNYFEGCGVPLKGTLSRSNYVCKFSLNNDPASPIWSIFSSPCKISLPDASTAQLTSSTLLLNDYAGNSRGFGIGLDPGNAKFTFRYMTLVLTLKKYQGTTGTSKITYKLTF